MNSKPKIKSKKLYDDYEDILKIYPDKIIQFDQIPQWKSEGDFIQKFSLYQETPNSITSTDTVVNLDL